jgi:hypothetical protein
VVQITQVFHDAEVDMAAQSQDKQGKSYLDVSA